MNDKRNVAIVSVGTSILTNCLRAIQQFPEVFDEPELNELIMKVIQKNAKLPTADEEVLSNYILRKFCYGLSRHPDDSWKWVIHSDSSAPNIFASAELQSTYHFFQQKGWLTDSPQEIIYLISTDTFKCELSAKIIKAFLLAEGIGHEVHIERIVGLDVTTNYAKGIENLFVRLDDVQSKLQTNYRDLNLTIYFNFTGGYKGVIPKLQRYADVHGFRIFYQYEMQDTIVELNPISHELDILTNTYIHLKEKKIYGKWLNTQQKKSLEDLSEKGFFIKERGGNSYQRTSEGKLAYESIKKVNLQILKLFGFNMEYYFFELLLNEPLFPDWTVVRRSVKFDSNDYETREIDLVVGTPQNPERMMAEVKSFLQIYDYQKPNSKLKKQLMGQLKVISYKNSLPQKYKTDVYALFLYGNEDTDWTLLLPNLREVKQLIASYGISEFRVFYFGVPYNSSSKEDSPYRQFLNSKATFKTPTGRYLQVKELEIG